MDNFGGFCPVEIRYMTKKDMAKYLCGFEISKKVALVAEEIVIKSAGLDQMIWDMDGKYEFKWVKGVVPNPTQETVMSALEFIGERPELIIAIGGGSTMDLAKGISAFFRYYEKGDLTIESMTQVIKDKSYRGSKDVVPIYAVPTTSGTGSEFTKWATIWDLNKTAKFSIDDNELYAKEALLVPEMLHTVPKRMMLSTGLDAMCQAMESFWAKTTNPLVQDIATMAMIRIKQNLKNALKDEVDEKAMEGMSMGSSMAGIAFSNTRTTACHSISYPMTMMFGVPHGFACILTLNEVAKRNKLVVPKINDMLEEVFGDSENGLANWLKDVSEGIQELTLSGFGIDEKEIPRIAAAAFTAGRMDNNPVDFSQKDVEEILYAIK